jgi:hypothetical protein
MIRQILPALITVAVFCVQAMAAAPSGPIVIKAEGGGAATVSTATAAMVGTVNLSPKTKPIDVRREQVMQILRLIQPNQRNARVAEAALIAAGKENLPVLVELKEHPERLVGPDEPTTDTYATTEGVEFTDKRPREERTADLRTWRLEAVEAVINQFTQGFDPVMAIEKWAGGKSAAGAQPLKDDSLARLFPDFAFWWLNFRMYPVAMMPPEPLKAHNIFVIDRKGNVQDLTRQEELQAWFREHLPPIKDEAAAKMAVRAWLACTQLLVTDGFYKFSLAEDSLNAEKAGGGLKATGRLEAGAGGGPNSGTVSVTLPFDAAGKLGTINQEAKLRPGPRPICQSTRLLDPDPLVRRMAEDCLRIMGPDALPYLADQRSRCGPGLQAEIDRVMARIVNGE